jgi:hypothetical protein
MSDRLTNSTNFQAPPGLPRWRLVPRKLKPLKVRPCPECGEATTSASWFYCAGCHFKGWWGRWSA